MYKQHLQQNLHRVPQHLHRVPQHSHRKPSKPQHSHRKPSKPHRVIPVGSFWRLCSNYHLKSRLFFIVVFLYLATSLRLSGRLNFWDLYSFSKNNPKDSKALFVILTAILSISLSYAFMSPLCPQNLHLSQHAITRNVIERRPPGAFFCNRITQSYPRSDVHSYLQVGQVNRAL